MRCRVCNGSPGATGAHVEIGAGHSTRFLAGLRDGGLNTGITSLDPEPRSMLNGPSGVERLPHRYNRRALTSSPNWWRAISFPSVPVTSGISTAMSPPFNEILPLLARGCRVHFHIFFCPVDILSTRHIDSTTNELPSPHWWSRALGNRIRVRGCGSPFGG